MRRDEFVDHGAVVAKDSVGLGVFYPRTKDKNGKFTSGASKGALKIEQKCKVGDRVVTRIGNAKAKYEIIEESVWEEMPENADDEAKQLINSNAGLRSIEERLAELEKEKTNG